jgi:hypothetical protein
VFAVGSFGARPSASRRLGCGDWGRPARAPSTSNSRPKTSTQVASANVATLKKKWSVTTPGSGPFGNFATTPIVFGGVVYFQDLNSNVYAVDQQTGALKWKRAFKSPSIGPYGVSIAYGLLFGAAVCRGCVLNPATGADLKHTLTPSIHGGITRRRNSTTTRCTSPRSGASNTSTSPRRSASSTRWTRRRARRSGHSTPSRHRRRAP